MNPNRVGASRFFHPPRTAGAGWLLVAPAGLVALLALASPSTAAQELQELPPDEAGALERLNSSPRHGEWVTMDAGRGDEVSAWVVYPERSDAAPVVLVIHEIYGLTDWIRAVADQAAAEGFIAIAPDLLSGKGPDGGDSRSLDRQDAVAAIRDLDRTEVSQRLMAAGEYAMALPAAAPRVASVGFCWGGEASFLLATAWPELDGAAVYYGTSPPTDALSAIEASVLGLYGGDDNRVNSTIPAAQDEMERLGKMYEPLIFDGAGHGFLRAQDGQDGANMEASREAWPRTIEFFREVLEGEG